MAKKTAKLKTIYDKPWKHLVAAAIAFILTYGAASWSIDSGRLTAYLISIILFVLGVRHLVQAARQSYEG